MGKETAIPKVRGTSHKARWYFPELGPEFYTMTFLIVS